MILYAIPISTYSAKVRIALEAKGLDYTMEPPPGGYSTPQYMELIPLGTIPALVDGEFRCSESDVLIEYLDETYPDVPLLPGSPSDRAHQRFVSRFHDLWLEPHLRRTFVHVDPAARIEAELSGHLDKFQERLNKLESLIEPSPYLCGPSLSIADCAFPATFVLAELLLAVFDRRPQFGSKTAAWLETVLEHPAVKKITDECRNATIEWMNSGGG